MFGKLASTSNSLFFQLNPIKLQWLQMQSKKTKLQSSTFSLPYSVQLKISSKIVVRFNW